MQPLAVPRWLCCPTGSLGVDLQLVPEQVPVAVAGALSPDAGVGHSLVLCCCGA